MELPILISGTLLAIATVLFWRYRWQFLNAWYRRSLIRAAEKIGFQQVSNVGSYDSLFPQPVRSVDPSDPLCHVLKFETSTVAVTLFEVQSIPLVARGCTCLLFQSSQLDLPEFFMRPEGCLDKVGSIFGWQDLDFALRPDFSYRYLLQGEDELAVRYYFSNDMLDLFEHQPDQRVEATGNQLLISRPKKRLSHRRFAEYFADAFRIFEKARTLNQALRQADQLENSLATSTRELQEFSAEVQQAGSAKPTDNEHLADKKEDEDYIVI